VPFVVGRHGKALMLGVVLEIEVGRDVTRRGAEHLVLDDIVDALSAVPHFAFVS
jgi:hypothetical protein